MPVAELSDAKIHFTDTGGSWPVVLFLHAFPLHAGMWAAQAKAIAAKDFRAVAMDARGFGGSTPASGPLTMDLIADDAAGLLRSLAVTSAVVCGLSMGGYAALAFAARHPKMLAGLVLADTRAGADDDEGKKKREAFAVSAIAKGSAWVADEMAPKLQKAPPSPPADREIRALIARGTPAAIAAASRGLALRADHRATLKSIGVPALVLVGVDDKVTPPSESEAVAKALPHATLEKLPDAGHLSSLENPAAFNRALLAFLQKHFGENTPPT